jgi:hypothetical protein
MIGCILDTVKVAISLPDAVFEAGERAAKKLGVSRSALYAEAVARDVAELRARDVSARLDEVYRTEGSELDPVLARMQQLSLADEGW